MNAQYPLARKDGLVVRQLDAEVLVYDLARNKALCLNKLAGAVWKQSDGQTSARQIAEDLSGQLSVTVDERMVWAAIDQLGRDHLLEYCITMPARVTRRQQLKYLGKAAAFAGPLVAAVSAVADDDKRSCVPSHKPCTP